MISGEEIGRSLRGVGRFALLDRSGVQAFDGTPDAFWRSFFAAVLIAPPYFFMAVLASVDPARQVSLLRLLSAEAIGYVLIWTAFPLAMVYLCRALDRDSRYFTFMTAYNWAQVLEMAVWLLGLYLIESAASPALGGLIYWVVLALLLAYEWFIARVTLDLPGPAAALPVGLSFALTLTIGHLMDRSAQLAAATPVQ